MPRLKEFDLRQFVVLHEVFFPFLFKVAREQEMLVALVEHQADRIVVFVAAVLVIVIVENLHFDTVGNLKNALCAVLVVAALKGCIMRRSCIYCFL